MEPRFQADFSGVRVHADTPAAMSAAAVSARAYSVGRHIVFGAGSYQPETPDGRRLLAHELAHVRHEWSAHAGGPLTVGRADDRAEAAAHATAEAVAEGRTAPPQTGRPTPAAGAAVLRRQPAQTGPQIYPGEGTTADLELEKKRLEREQRSLHVSTIEPETEARYNQYFASIDRLELLLAERGDPSALPDSGVELTFDGVTLGISTGASWPAVSGRPDAAGKFDYSPARQRLEGVGPIPEGDYWIDPGQLVDLSQKWFYRWRFKTSWGSHRITVHPLGSTHTFGRGGFFIHGGTVPGSAGCIDLTTHIDAFASAIAAVPAHTKVKLTVSYPGLP